MNNFCDWFLAELEASGVTNQIEPEKWQKWQEFDRMKPIFGLVGEEATNFLKNDYIHFLRKVGQLGGSATSARQASNNIKIGFISRDGTVLGGLKKARNSIQVEFSPREIVTQYGIDIARFTAFMKQMNDEGYDIRIDNWCAIKELNASTAEIASKAVNIWASKVESMITTDTSTKNESKFVRDLELSHCSLNQILYGPPGTGKTYHTIEAAVKAAESEYYSSLNIDLELGATIEQRQSLQDKYKELTKDGRIRFVTFHQSYGYEEFVEGMKAITNEDNQIEYQVQSGVFKDICLDALVSVSQQPSALKRDARIWKLSIDGVKQSKARDYCFANDLAAIGWGNAGDMSDEDRTADQIEYFEKLGSQAKSSVMEFSGRMAEGDIVVCVKGQWSIQAVGVVSGDYQYREQGIEGRLDFCHTIPVKWLAKDIDVNLYALNDNTRLTLKTCYELTRFNSTELYEVLKSEGVSLNNNGQLNDQPQNYVLVIDEINRGNISKIFGELITLIEPSKRKGSDEFIELTLPQSKKPFSVPDNLHIIGTMNTADRSLAMMDTALRRRFDFIEMMPKPELLANTVVDDIDLEELLTVLNERIEILYDREHTLGHAFFMPVKKLVDANQQEKAFTALVSVFQNKIIPLLEEYFFEDWDKIRLVLADNQKEETLQFVSEKSLDNSKLSALFGKKHGLNQYGETQKQYILKKKSDGVWKNVRAYKEVYATSDKQGE